jgi:sec-independent protein translocase protein TatC
MAVSTGSPPAGGKGDEGLSRMSLADHLGELRRRVIVTTVAVAAGAVVAFFVYNWVLSFLVHPLCQAVRSDPAAAPSGCKLLVTDPLEGFATRLKVSGFVGLFLASPVVLWELWRFVTPGLHPREKRYAIPFIVSSILLFSGGAAVAILTFRQVLGFLIAVSGQNTQAFYSPSKYINLYVLMMVVFGLAFEFPVLLVSLGIAGVVPSSRLIKSWRAAVVIIFVFAAVITPSNDPYSFFGMALPMCFFYGVSILILRLLKK